MRKIGLLALILLLAACGRNPAPTSEPTLDAQAATIFVNTTTDELDNIVPNNKCSLREAIISANNNSNFGGCTSSGSYGTDTVRVPSGTFILTRELPCVFDQDCGGLNILSNMTLDGAGPGSTIIRQQTSLFTSTLTLGEFNKKVTVTIKDVTLRSPGATSSTLFNQNATTRLENSIVEDSSDEGIFNSDGSTLTIVKSIIRNNNNKGILNRGVLTISDSTIAGNDAFGDGGGIAQQSTGGPTTITNTTISGNSASGTGGGIFVNGGTFNIANSTITGNSATNFVGGIFRSSTAGQVILSNTIVAGNTANAVPDCSGAFASGGNNFIGIVTSACTGFSSLFGDQRGTETTPLNPQLGPLADNGGPTPTHALLRGSSAIDRGNPSICPTTDQRGVARAFDGNNDSFTFCDIGAFEYNTPFSADLRVNLDDNPGTVSAGGTFSYIMTLSNAGPDRAVSVKGVLGVPSTVTVLSPLPSGCSLVGTTITCNLGLSFINPGASVVKTINVRAPSVAPSNNLIAALASVTSITPDPDTQNNKRGTGTTIVNPQSADLALSLSSSVGSIIKGNTFNYTLRVTNNGPNTASNIVLRQTLPSGVSFQSASAGCSISGSTVTCNVASLASGASSTSTITVLASAAGTATSNANISSATPTDPNSANNSASTSVTITLPATDLSVAIVAPTQNANLPRNTDLAYDIRVRNNNATSATTANVVLTVTFPNNVTNIRVPASCSLSGLVATCNIGTMNAATAVARNITVRLPNSATTVSATAVVTLANSDPNTANNQVTRRVNVQ